MSDDDDNGNVVMILSVAPVIEMTSVTKVELWRH